ncbi:Ppx/GppA family phosphatase [Burkholderiaceae bacterium FT117]|uniref:Ppx/GppA phosphatase family protein n=1 Tax=Zeimonas sediminis TaxID=2944268 RepID=UPI0023430971|nr:Ppx/GppA phosphatase family protein [Zeimonas sediminis]MCM5571717.1 Ppx/GppA family phosphatase [Zeimonas sediminis]
MPEEQLLAAVDLGSNSFRLMIGRVAPEAGAHRIDPIDNLKRTVRLAAGLRDDGSLDADAQTRGVEALARFGERLRSFAPHAVRAVATNTLRVASNAAHFLATAEAALGFPIEVISGHEEARLIYLGAAHALPRDGLNRLVIDIGGGSTECIVGSDFEPGILDSAGVGCVALTRRFFADATVGEESFGHAYAVARARFEELSQPFLEAGWDYAVGTSGTAKALVQIARLEFGRPALDREGLALIRDALLQAGSADALELQGLKTDRRPVLAGGLAVMLAAFDEFGIESLDYCGGALRHGVLHDLVGRAEGADPRVLTVRRMIERHGIDARHAARVRDTALALFDQGARASKEELQARRRLLEWAALLAECGMSISHEGFHKHSAYILSWADMPGFSRPEQETLALLALAQVGGLRKLRGRIEDELGWLMVVALRVARILHRARDGDEVPLPALFFKRGGLRLEVPRDWAARQPLAHASLVDEAALWNEAKVFGRFAYQTI